ncbi:hypothetical protein [Terriglobus sp. ADX1]|uniref:hypothetical protein n=1 Tax=Terriglobus sp. ADX1 TaxID=2794063 RepID=UPI002FE5A35F
MDTSPSAALHLKDESAETDTARPTGETGKSMALKKSLWVIGGVCAAAAGWIVLGPKRTQAVQDLARQLETAWADHHTEA